MSLEDLNKIDMSKLVDDFISDLDDFDWKHEGEFLIFLNELKQYLLSNRKIDSEEFLYDTEGSNSFTAKDNYDEYIDSFCNLIFSYCRKYGLPEINDSIEENLYFNEYCVLVKVDDVFYKVERISGQGTIDIISLYDGENKDFYIDYYCAVNDEEPINYSNICKDILEKALEEFKEEFKIQLSALNYDVCTIDKNNIK